MELVPKSFEYSHLDRETRTIVRQRTLEIKNLMRLTAENIINIGQKLTEIKEKLGHGNFQKWLRSEFEWSEQTARQFMQVYRWSETIENKNFVFSRLATSALYLLAAPSTPTEAREEVISLVDGNEKINYTRVKSIVDRYKSSPGVDPEVVNTVNIQAENELKVKPDDTCDRLFRLETSELGCIVRLYRVEELEVITDLTIGSIVKIKVGRWQGQTAEIVEVLQERLSIPDAKPVAQTSSNTQSPDDKIVVRTIERMDLSDIEKLPDIGQKLIINYGNTLLVIEGVSKTLNAFTERIKTSPAFVESIFRQALDIHQPEV